MTIENAVYRQVAIRWDAVTLPLKAGTPVSEAGTVANDGSAVGIVTQTVAVRPPVDGILVLVGGDVARAEVEQLYGAALEDTALEAMSGIRFFGEHGTPYVKPESGGGSGGVFTVTYSVTAGLSPTATADKSVTELSEAWNAGKIIRAIVNFDDSGYAYTTVTYTVRYIAGTGGFSDQFDFTTLWEDSNNGGLTSYSISHFVDPDTHEDAVYVLCSQYSPAQSGD